MASLNKIMLIGRLGKDVELRHTASGTPVATFSLATSEKTKNKSGEYEEKTEWHNIVLWQKQAELAAEYLAKGSQVYIEGRIQTRKWQDKDGNDRYTTEIIGDRLQFLDSKPKTEGGRSTGGEPRNGKPAGGSSYEEFPPQDFEDIPF